MRLSLRKVLGLFKRSLFLDRPHHVQWMLTRRCNYRCKSCDVWRGGNLPEELSIDKVRAGLDILHDLGVVEIVLSGGNPLLRKDIGEIIDYASKYFITTIYDNGSLAAKNVDILRKADFVAISFDTLDEDRYDYLKGVPGAWKHAINSIRTLHEEGISVGVSPTISQFNMHEILDFTEHFRERGIPVLYCLYQHDSLAEPMFQIGEKNEELEITDREGLAQICSALIEKKKKSRGILITKKTLNTLRELYLNDRRTWNCRALHSFFTIDPAGRVAACHLQEPVGTIFDLPRLWNGEKFKELRRMYNECTKCSYMCYMFYSLHASVQGNIAIITDQWKNAGALFGH